MPQRRPDASLAQTFALRHGCGIDGVRPRPQRFGLRGEAPLPAARGGVVSQAHAELEIRGREVGAVAAHLDQGVGANEVARTFEERHPGDAIERQSLGEALPEVGERVPARHQRADPGGFEAFGGDGGERPHQGHEIGLVREPARCPQQRRRVDDGSARDHRDQGVPGLLQGGVPCLARATRGHVEDE
jgi:hypothetical protein